MAGGCAFRQPIALGCPDCRCSAALGEPITLAWFARISGICRVSYLDLGTTFDAVYAQACGVNLEALLVARPTSVRDTLDLLVALAERSEIGLVLIDSLALLQRSTDGTARLLRCLPALLRALAVSRCSVLALTPLPYPVAVTSQIGQWGAPLAHHAAVRLHLGEGRWDTSDPACPAHITRIVVLKQRGSADGRAGEVTIPFPDAGSMP